MLYHIRSANPERKISFIKDLRALNGLLDGGHLGLREAKALADRVIDAGGLITVNVPDHQAPLFEAWFDSRDPLDVTKVTGPALTDDEIDYAREASYAYAGYNHTRHFRVLDALHEVLGAQSTQVDLPLEHEEGVDDLPF